MKTLSRDAEDAVKTLIEYVGDDPEREGLLNTPSRVARAMLEMCDGYRMDPAKLLGTTFSDKCDEMVVVRDIAFCSLCEHHLLPFTGVAHVAYVPLDKVVGLSKLARLVDCFAHRFQIQERMTCQIAEAIDQHLHPRGVGVVVEAHHSCMSCRGVRQSSARMVTSALIGLLKKDGPARAEFLSMARSR